MTDLALACQLSSPDLQRRKAGLLAQVRARATAIRPSPEGGGVQLEFADSAATLADVLELIRLESACCRFLRFRLRTGPDGSPTTLELLGPPGTAEFLAALGWSAPGTV